MATSSVNDLIMRVLESQYDSDTDKDTAKKVALISEIRKARPPLADRWLYRNVVWILGLTVFMTLGVGIWIISDQKPSEIPSGLVAIGSAAVGALAGLISPTGGGNDDK